MFSAYLGFLYSLREGGKMIDLKKFSTEKRNPNTMSLDTMTPLEIVSIMNQEDSNVITAVNSQLEKVAEVVSWATDSLYRGGRIIYMGAGTSGRLGVMDAVECPPTFGVDFNTVVGLIAGGEQAFIKAQECAEDSQELGRKDLVNIGLNENDIVIGIAASGRTPYVIGGLVYAKEVGCKTATVSCNENAEIGTYADISIEAVVGPEVLTGSTRLKAGTAQKMILNMISTGAMIGYGKAYDNLMVDVKQSNDKLVVRAQNIVMEATGASREIAKETLEKSNDSVKVAIVMIMFDVEYDEATSLLEEAKGHIKKINKEKKI